MIPERKPVVLRGENRPCLLEKGPYREGEEGGKHSPNVEVTTGTQKKTHKAPGALCDGQRRRDQQGGRFATERNGGEWGEF